MDVEATLAGLFQNAFTNLLTGSAHLVIEPVQPEISDLTPILDEIDSVVSQELALHAYDPILNEAHTWSVSEAVKREWVAVDPDTLEVKLSIPSETLQNMLQTWEADLGEGRKFANLPENDAIHQAWAEGEGIQAEIHHEATIYEVGVGESLWSISLKIGMPMWYIMDANPRLTSNNITSGMSLTIPTKNILLPLPLIENKRIVIDISEQKMTVYENGQVRNTHIVSTGVSDSPTMTGVFQIQTHEINAYASNWDLYMPHFMGIYEAWPGFMNGIHGLPLLSNGQRLWASTLGSPASYGCIILDLGAAEDLFYWADPGVVVEITQ
jgi:LysM repeat protein